MSKAPFVKIFPEKSFTLDRLIVVPDDTDDHPFVYTRGMLVRGFYMRHPALIQVKAFTGGEASARADEVQANTHNKLWNRYDSKPWAPNKTEWIEVECPDGDPYILG